MTTKFLLELFICFLYLNLQQSRTALIIPHNSHSNVQLPPPAPTPSSHWPRTNSIMGSPGMEFPPLTYGCLCSPVMDCKPEPGKSTAPSKKNPVKFGKKLVRGKQHHLEKLCWSKKSPRHSASAWPLTCQLTGVSQSSPLWAFVSSAGALRKEGTQRKDFADLKCNINTYQ